MGTSLISNDSASCPYEIGDGFWTKNTTPPSERWPGTTWEQLKDTFLLSSGDTYSIGQTGGEATHTLNTTEMPYHNHVQYQQAGNGGITWCVTDPSITPGSIKGLPLQTSAWSDGSSATIDTGYVGEGKAHNNMPPYTVRSYWERTG